MRAEVIAERGLRDLHDKQQQLQLLEAIASASIHATSVTDALKFAVRSICQFTGWQVGRAYLADAAGAEVYLVSASIWHRVDAERFHESFPLTEPLGSLSAFGLPARVLSSSAPAWVMDVSCDPQFPRAGAAGQAVLKAAFAFPILLGGEVVAVVEFFTDRLLEPDDALLSMMAQIGNHLSRVIERKRVEDRLADGAFHDPLTSLPNRALFANRLTHALACGSRHRDGVVAVLFVELDRFELINTSLGHGAGDTVIVDVTSRLERCLREQGMLARIGHDEFAVLLDGIGNVDDAVRVSELLVGAFEKPFLISGEQIYLRTNIGIATHTVGDDTLQDLLHHANLAMYCAKTLDNGRCKLYDPTMRKQAVNRLALESNLQRALRNDEYVLHYQPIVSLKSGEIVGAEALVRWRKSEYELVYPAEFVEIAEDTGLILPLGIWVLREACTTMARWRRVFPGTPPLTISVNISGHQFKQPDFVELVGGVIADTGISPEALSLEVTESVAMVDSERALSAFEQLRELGVRIGIDDFGTGYSSLGYLHRFPLDFLKIDRSFVARLGRGEDGMQIVKTILSLARNLDIQVIAEGTETQSHVETLKSMGCDFAQGYFFSKPLESSCFAALLARTGEAWGAGHTGQLMAERPA
ncbi:GGDEF domain-containing protein [Cupriavidus sp. CV2]|uniref:putative bifunctional diguanylate cyclase/phosphodiesterase n=1 Tax=Cupriavidus ulmosensis TaxID=3065913 RepID=UPI00296AB201|nr:GGDEF domain-containing protein [Cupriavidus sp. CV2]MDW3689024.1 GGDEF domain-containing protein [Cupriavidus sp. CV2]